MSLSLFVLNLAAFVAFATPSVLILNSAAPPRTELIATLSAGLFAGGAAAYLLTSLLLSLRRPSPSAAIRIGTVAVALLISSAVVRFLPG